MLKIVTIPNAVLTTPAKPVDRIDEKIRNLVIDMEETLIAQVDPQGVGLAAPQVGAGLRLFLMKQNPDEDTEVFINPKILESTPYALHPTPSKKKKGQKLEGCLSIPAIWAPVKRPNKVYVEYQNLTGKIKKQWFSGLKATIIQHEIDHLEGVLFTQRALEQNSVLYEEKNGEFQEIKALM